MISRYKVKGIIRIFVFYVYGQGKTDLNLFSSVLWAEWSLSEQQPPECDLLCWGSLNQLVKDRPGLSSLGQAWPFSWHSLASQPQVRRKCLFGLAGSTQSTFIIWSPTINNAVHSYFHWKEDIINERLLRMSKMVWCCVQFWCGLYQETLQEHWKGETQCPCFVELFICFVIERWAGLQCSSPRCHCWPPRGCWASCWGWWGCGHQGSGWSHSTAVCSAGGSCSGGGDTVGQGSQLPGQGRGWSDHAALCCQWGTPGRGQHHPEPRSMAGQWAVLVRMVSSPLRCCHGSHSGGQSAPAQWSQRQVSKGLNWNKIYLQFSSDWRTIRVKLPEILPRNETKLRSV